MKFATLAGLLSLTVAGSAFAQAAAPAPVATPANSTIQTGGPQGGQRPPHELNGDTNHDGFISLEEWRARGDQMFKEIDSNGDGKISPEEMRAHHEKEHNEWQQRHGFGGGQGQPGGAPVGAPGTAPAPASAPVKH